MNFRKLLTGTWVLVMLVLSACGDDDSAPKKQFAFGDKTFQLKNANIFLAEAWTGGETRTERYYVITDGTFRNNTFENSTFFVEVQLAIPIAEEEFSAGDYPQWYWWDEAPATSKISYLVGYPRNEEFWIDTPLDVHTPVKVSGGLEVGETVTLRYDGNLDYNYTNTDDETVTETVTGKFYFKGKIQEIAFNQVPLRKKLKGQHAR